MKTKRIVMMPWTAGVPAALKAAITEVGSANVYVLMGSGHPIPVRQWLEMPIETRTT